MIYRILIFILMGLATACYQEKRIPATIAEKIAAAHGLEAFEKINTLTYTFNLKHPSGGTQRTWVWDRAGRRVTLMTPKDTLTYHRDSVTTRLQPADHRFINDQYWLLFPFHLVWDEGIAITEHGLAKAPISGRKLSKITVQYGPEGGYTPGDAYDLYVDGEFLIREWAFRKGGQAEPSLITTWENYRHIKGVEVATMHRNKEKDFKVFFTGLIFQ